MAIERIDFFFPARFPELLAVAQKKVNRKRKDSQIYMMVDAVAEVFARFGNDGLITTREHNLIIDLQG